MTAKSCHGTDGNAILSGHLLYKTHYPAQTSGQSLVHRTSLQSSNAVGEVIRSTDPAGGGGRIDTTYSTAGRVVLREVHTFASGFDTSVKSIETTYDGMDLERSSCRLVPSTHTPSSIPSLRPTPSPPPPPPARLCGANDRPGGRFGGSWSCGKGVGGGGGGAGGGGRKVGAGNIFLRLLQSRLDPVDAPCTPRRCRRGGAHFYGAIAWQSYRVEQKIF
jgi:hypothetical protein